MHSGDGEALYSAPLGLQPKLSRPIVLSDDENENQLRGVLLGLEGLQPFSYNPLAAFSVAINRGIGGEVLKHLTDQVHRGHWVDGHLLNAFQFATRDAAFHAQDALIAATTPGAATGGRIVFRASRNGALVNVTGLTVSNGRLTCTVEPVDDFIAITRDGSLCPFLGPAAASRERVPARMKLEAEWSPRRTVTTAYIVVSPSPSTRFLPLTDSDDGAYRVAEPSYKADLWIEEAGCDDRVPHDTVVLARLVIRDVAAGVDPSFIPNASDLELVSDIRPELPNTARRLCDEIQLHLRSHLGTMEEFLASERLDVSVLKRYIWFTSLLDRIAAQRGIFLRLPQGAPNEIARSIIEVAGVIREYVRADFGGEAAFEDPVAGGMARLADRMASFRIDQLALGVDGLLDGTIELLNATNDFLETV